MSDLTLVIGNKNYSSWSLRPWIYMKNRGMTFKEKRIPLSTKDTPRLLSPYFSGSKVPVLVDGLYDQAGRNEPVTDDSIDILFLHYPVRFLTKAIEEVLEPENTAD